MNPERLAYLEALDIPVWVSSGSQAPAASPLITLGPGTGAHLFICADRQFSSSRLAADIMRALPDHAVWAWPEPGEPGVEVADVIDAKLITSVTLFGEELAMQLFARQVPKTVGTARLCVVGGPGDLNSDAGQRRKLWRWLCDCGAAVTT